jgi:hypothetical protein
MRGGGWGKAWQRFPNSVAWPKVFRHLLAYILDKCVERDLGREGGTNFCVIILWIHLFS